MMFEYIASSDVSYLAVPCCLPVGTNCISCSINKKKTKYFATFVTEQLCLLFCCYYILYKLYSISVESISDVFTIEKLKEKQERSDRDNTSGSWGAGGVHGQGGLFHHQFTGILFAYLTHLDITGSTNSIICYRWFVRHFKIQC